MQIRTRLTLQFTVLVAGILVVSLTSIYLSRAGYRERDFKTHLRAKAYTTADLFINVQEVDSSLLRVIDRNRKDVFPQENITIYDATSRVVYTSTDSAHFATTPARLAEIVRDGEIRWVEGQFEIVGIPIVAAQGKFVVVAGAVDHNGMAKLSNLRGILLKVFLGGLLAVCIAGWVYAGRALRPINQIVESMKKINASNLHARLDEGNRKDEIARLAQTFNIMLARVEQAFELQKTFVANVSHELKNPLTKITAQLEVVLLRPREVEEYRRIIDSVLEDTKSLNRAVLSLLDLARVTADDGRLPMAPTRIDEVLLHCREHLVFLHSDYQIEIDFALPDDEQRLLIMGNEYLLSAAMHNLMDNGCKFSEDHKVTVSLRLEAGQIVVHMSDHGIGIDQDDLADIFQPFFRGRNAAATMGHGIGLSLVARIVALHQGVIKVHSVPSEGTEFELRFPTLHAS